MKRKPGEEKQEKTEYQQMKQYQSFQNYQIHFNQSQMNNRQDLRVHGSFQPLQQSFTIHIDEGHQRKTLPICSTMQSQQLKRI
eukprot:5640174-Amphidinium_carterae.1